MQLDDRPAVDDRLSTVLRMRIGSAAGERTQFRQLLDLLGSASAKTGKAGSHNDAYARLEQLQATITPDGQGRILREPGLRLRNPALVAFLADGHSQAAAAAMATATLNERQWQALIPDLPVTARGFLRNRRDLPVGVQRTLKELGVGDLALTDKNTAATENTAAKPPRFADAAIEQPAALAPVPAPAPTPPLPLNKIDESTQPIGALIERIEQFRTARRMPVLAPRLPLGDAAPSPAPARVEGFEAVTDASGQVTWASVPVAPQVVGMILTSPQPAVLARHGPASLVAMRRRQPIHAAALTIGGETPVSGHWRMDATPAFTQGVGAFTGYRCRLMRMADTPQAVSPVDSSEDRMRQVLHELRTPVNAIQGFAEIIQQQLFGTVPHEYRAQAAAIAGDAAKLLAGFEDLDRLARLESGALVPETGEADLRAAVTDTMARLEPGLAARSSGFDLKVAGSPFTVDLDRSAAMALCWRILASAAGALAADERAAIALTGDGKAVTLDVSLPASLQGAAGTVKPAATPPRTAISAGMFGPQFAFRLATAEAKAAGGEIIYFNDKLRLTLPILTGQNFAHSKGKGEAGA